ncbi:MAG: hypothetical protein CVU04_01965 [Bacteroidetes bacterium HGW-Bacteroidetes-20]|nr:MAG: hypothetical protein CVU04_01965 [Bacteroidetes bacterium HGW-Bacteroidetes-20]
MDKKQIIILIIIAGIYIFNAIRKMKAKADVNNSPENTPFDDDEDEFESDVEFEPIKNDPKPHKDFNPFVKKYQFIAENLESTSLESESLETNSDHKIDKKSPIYDSQISDNEEYNTNIVSTEIEDIRKGVLYSEILKKKYN